MRRSLTWFVSVALCAAPVGAQSPAVRVVRLPSLAAGARVRVPKPDSLAPRAVRRATMQALRDAGFVVVTNEPRQPGEHVLVLSARCMRRLTMAWRCSEYAARLVEVASTDVHATATLNPLVRPPTPLAVIAQSVRDGLAR